jgi:uncharacterized protein YegP (UPF0339 family)
MDIKLSYYVQLFKGKNQEWFWRIRSRNGQILATSEGYTTKQSAQEVAQNLHNSLVFSEYYESDENAD